MKVMKEKKNNVDSKSSVDLLNIFSLALPRNSLSAYNVERTNSIELDIWLDWSNVAVQSESIVLCNDCMEIFHHSGYVISAYFFKKQQ